MSLRIAGGTVYDPANGVNGEVRDICIDDSRIVASLPVGAPRIDARGMIVMPGGVDIHSHVAGSSVNLARRLLPEEHDADPAPRPDLLDDQPLARSGTGGTVPSTFTTGYRYAGLGYTTVFDAADEERRIAAGLDEDVGEHGGGCGLAVGAGHHD